MQKPQAMAEAGTTPPVRAPYACHPKESRGRLVAEEESDSRSVFQRDRDRIIHSSAFRRLKHKTQVFVSHEGDHFRTRLTHTLEVAQIARSMARTLALDEDLTEALALSHDFGHPPFGHAGEDALQECMEPFQGFDHNAHALRIVTELESRYADFDGLNLTWETLEGMVKHNGPLLAGPDDPGKHLPQAILAYSERQDLALHSYASVEAQIAALSDDIAYNNHDLDDGLRAGLFSIDQLRDVPMVGALFAEMERRYPGIEEERLIHEVIRRQIGTMIRDVIGETRRRIAAAEPASVQDIRQLHQPVVAFSEEMAQIDRAIRAFLFENMYRHYKVNRMTSKARRVVRDLFALFLEDPGVLPTAWRQKCDGRNTGQIARIACDFIAGMTDRFALEEHGRLFSWDVRSH